MSTITQPKPGWMPENENDPYFYGWRMVPRWREDGSLTHERVPLTEWDVLHPQEDDFIMQTDVHWRNVTYLREAFERSVAGREGAVVLSDHRIDWEVPGIEPHGPDDAVFFGVTGWHGQLGTFPVKTMNAEPILVVEVTSPSTREGDLNAKVVEYHLAGVPLYMIADIREFRGRYSVSWIIYRNTPGGYMRSPFDATGRFRIDALDVTVGVEGENVVVFDANGYRIPRHLELDEQRRAALKQAEDEKKRAEDEKKRADTATNENVDLKRRMEEMEAELRRIRGAS